MISYGEYIALYGKCDEDDFARLVRKASAFVDYITSSDVATAQVIDDNVKMAVVAVLDEMKAHEDGEHNVSSETVGRVSRTYSDAVTDETEAYYKAAFLYLANTGLLRNGVMLNNDYKL